MEQVDSDEYNKNKVYRKGSEATGICSPCEVSLGETASNVSNLIQQLASLSRSILTDTIKTRSAARADLIFMAPATGIEPVTNP